MFPELRLASSVLKMSSMCPSTLPLPQPFAALLWFPTSTWGPHGVLMAGLRQPPLCAAACCFAFSPGFLLGISSSSRSLTLPGQI